jgi:hypothetical protein
MMMTKLLYPIRDLFVILSKLYTRVYLDTYPVMTEAV